MIGDHKAEIQTQDFMTVICDDKVVTPNAEDIKKEQERTEHRHIQEK
jgi:hypothetical protein